MATLARNDPAEKAGPLNVRPDPPDVQAFKALAAARRRGDRSRLRQLVGELLALGWVCYATEPRVAGRAVGR